jgi:hypothetical protein
MTLSQTYDLQLDSLSLQLDRPDLEIDTDGRDVGLGVGVIGESQEKTGFPNTRISDQEKLFVGGAA